MQHSLLVSVDKLQLTTGGSPLRLQTSDFRVVTIIVPRDKDAQVLIGGMWLSLNLLLRTSTPV